MIALDTNLLVYSHRRDSAWHEGAANSVRSLAESRTPWALPWPCVHEFLAIVTHPRIYAPPSTIAQAMDQVRTWLESPSVVMLSEGEGHWDALAAALELGQVRGPQVHDARIVALCQQHGVRELLTADRDFSRFPGLRTRNPLVGT